MKRNHAISFILTLGLAVLLGGSAAAQPLCHGALRLRVNDKGLAFIGEQVRPLVPKSVAIPAIKKSVLDWPVAKSDAIVETTLQPAQIKLHDLTLSISGDALQVRGKADVSTSGPVTVHNAYMGVGTANCRADVNIKDLELVVGMKFTTNGGRITTKVTEALITLDNDKSKLALEKCTLGNILTTVVTFLRKHFMGAIQAGVAKIAKSKIPALVSAKLDESIRITKQVKGFQVTGTLDALSTDSLGVEVGLGAGVGLVSESHPPCLGKVNTKAPVSCTSVQPTLKPAVDAMFGVGVSQQIINHGLHAAWRSGMLCVDSERITSPLLTDNLSKLAPALGLPASTRLDFSLRLLTAPRVSMTSDGGMALQIDPMLLRLVMDPPKGPRNEMIISAGMTVAVAPWINPEDNSVSLDVKSMNISRLEMQPPAGSAGKAITLDVARLNRFITTVAVPMIKERLSGSPISPSVIAVKSFLRFNDKYKVKPTSRTPQGKFSLHFEEQKLPPMGDDLVIKSASIVPMLSSEWQAMQDPDDREQSAAAVKFRYDGKFVANPKVLGRWSVIAQVAEIAEFDPEQKAKKVRNPLFATITLKDGGKTDDPTWVWSDDILMDLNKYQALKMIIKTIDSSDYLFIEAGGFSTRNKPGWKSPLYVMKKK